MKNVFYALSLILASLNLTAQNSLNTDIVVKSTKEVSLGKITLTVDLDSAYVIKHFGRPDRLSVSPSGEYALIYDQHGMGISFTTDQKLALIAVVFQTGGDELGPNGLYKGKLKVGEQEIKLGTKVEGIKGIKLIPYECLLDQVCFYNMEKEHDAIRSAIMFENGQISKFAVAIQ